MDVRGFILDGLGQLTRELDDALQLSPARLNWVPAEGTNVSCGFEAWHLLRTHDNIANFVFQRAQPVWLANGHHQRMPALPRVEQGTGMTLAAARALVFDPALLRDYGRDVAASVQRYVAAMPAEQFDDLQVVWRSSPARPRWQILRTQFLTHGFQHLGEMVALRGAMGLPYGV